MSTMPLGNTLLGFGAGAPEVQQAQQVQQASAPVVAPQQAGDPLAQQADALSKQIAALLVARESASQRFGQGVRGAALGAMAPPGTNPAPAIVSDLQRQQEAEQNAIQNRIQMLNQIREQQNTQRQLSQGQQRLGIEQGQLDSQEASRKETENWRKAQENRLNSQANANTIKEVPAGGKLVVFDKDGKVLQEISGTPKGTSAPSVKFSNDGIPLSVVRGQDEFTIGDPQMPPELKPLADAAVGSHKQRLQEQANIANQLAAAQDKRTADAAARNEAIKNSQAPDQTKNLVTAAYLTQDTISDVRDLMKAYPDLVGPAIGRMEEAAQGAGTSFGLQDPAREKAAANLAKNFADLVINEARTASPNRTPKEILDLVKATSANLAKNPNMVEGFLTGAEQGAQRAMRVGAQWGITPGGTAVKAKPQAAGPSGNFHVSYAGKDYPFDTQAQANEFKRRMGIQ